MHGLIKRLGGGGVWDPWTTLDSRSLYQSNNCKVGSQRFIISLHLAAFRYAI